MPADPKMSPPPTGHERRMAEPQEPGEPPHPAAGESAEMEAPPAPPEGYPRRAIEHVVAALGAALAAIGKAMHKQMPEVPEPPPKEAYDDGVFKRSLPAWLATEIAVILGTAASVGGKQEGRYDLDVMTLLADGDGLRTLAIALELVARDKVLLNRMRELVRHGAKGAGPTATAGAPPAPVAAAAPPSSSSADFM